MKCGNQFYLQLKTDLAKCATWEEKLEKMAIYVPPEVHNEYTPDALKAIATFIYKRLQVLDNYNPESQTPLRTPITLLKPTVPASFTSDETYGLHKVTQEIFLSFDRTDASQENDYLRRGLYAFTVNIIRYK